MKYNVKRKVALCFKNIKNNCVNNKSLYCLEITNMTCEILSVLTDYISKVVLMFNFKTNFFFVASNFFCFNKVSKRKAICFWLFPCYVFFCGFYLFIHFHVVVSAFCNRLLITEICVIVFLNYRKLWIVLSHVCQRKVQGHYGMSDGRKCRKTYYLQHYTSNRVYCHICGIKTKRFLKCNLKISEIQYFEWSL